MNNAEKFKQIFGLYAIELWSMPGGDFLEWLDRDVETTQIDHTADIGKKVSISCGHENDLISRKAAIEAIAKQTPKSYTSDGSHPADEEIFRAQEVFADCIEALEILPSAQPEQRWIPCGKCLHADGKRRRCKVLDRAINEDYFCYWAEPYREEGETE